MALFAFSQACCCWSTWVGCCLSPGMREMLSPGRGWAFLNRISCLVQVDQEELCRLREALEMGQNRAMPKTSLICGRKWRNWYYAGFPLLCQPFPEKSHLWPKSGDRRLFSPPTISDELQKHQSPAQTSIYILQSLALSLWCTSKGLHSPALSGPGGVKNRGATRNTKWMQET